MTKFFVAFFFLCLSYTETFAQGSPKQLMQVTTVESIIPGGLGRSRMIVTLPDGTQQEQDLENFYSLVGINFGNIKQNDNAILNKLNALITEGWEIENIATGVQSPSEGVAQGIFITRYLLSRAK
ncbi:MAG: hypothetical protein IPL35_00340 [Sphingobacteriales bacterium]|nr:hypothetical protein [Sphingobacteriales bacterium]